MSGSILESKFFRKREKKKKKKKKKAKYLKIWAKVYKLFTHNKLLEKALYAIFEW